MNNTNFNLTSILRNTPAAGAIIHGSEKYPSVHGSVRFYRALGGTLVLVQAAGLPVREDTCQSSFFGFHIHEGASCTGNETDPFADVGGHLNSAGCPHPFHIGDMPPLLGADGTAFLAFLTDRFIVDEIIGRTVIIHAGSDDFRTQPGGDSGEKMACGEIVQIGR